MDRKKPALTHTFFLIFFLLFPRASATDDSSRPLKNGHLLRFPCLWAGPSSLRRTTKYVSLLRIAGALHLALFEQPERNDFFISLLGDRDSLPLAGKCPVSPALEVGVKGHNIKGKYLTGKPAL